jgi:hypothetical protein
MICILCGGIGELHDAHFGDRFAAQGAGVAGRRRQSLAQLQRSRIFPAPLQPLRRPDQASRRRRRPPRTGCELVRLHTRQKDGIFAEVSVLSQLEFEMNLQTKQRGLGVGSSPLEFVTRSLQPSFVNYYRPRRRRKKPATPISPVPSSIKLPGSGVWLPPLP